MPSPERLGQAIASAFLVLCSVACGLGVESTGSKEPRSDTGDLTVADLVWVAGRTIEENDMATGLEMRLIRGDGLVAWETRLPLAADAGGGFAFMSGPRGGRLAYGLRTHGVTTIVVADAREGVATEIANMTDLVHGGVIAPDGTAAFLMVEGNRQEIQRIELEPGATPELVAILPPADPELPINPFNAVRMTPDGTRLIVERCGETGACRWAIVSLPDGAVREIQADGAGRIIDLSDDHLLTAATECMAGPCPYVIVDLEAGTGVAWDPGAHTARLVSMPDGGALLAYDTGGTGDGTMHVVLVDLETFDERPLADAGQPGAEFGLAREGQDDWAPPGWVVLVPPGLNLGEQGGPVLVNALDGRVVQLAAPAGS
jgi:hypothetical protein